MFTAETKSQLAKLLAEENLRVEHRKTKTAYFDLKTRTLVCPIWKNMTGAIYDLLMGHEVGHALYTPLEGWHQAIEGRERSNFKFFLNVLEDARIEKMMKRKFPGLISSFRTAYQQFRKDNFFGIEGKDVSTLQLIDRLNLLAKGGTLMELPFSDDETQYVTRMESLETWKEVCDLAQELYDRAKDDASMTSQNDLMGEQDGEDGDEGDDLYVMEGEGDDDADESDGDHEQSPSSRQMSPSKDDEDNTTKKPSKRSPGSGAGRLDHEIDPTSYTDEFFRKKEKSLLSTDSLDLVYATLPTPNLKNIVVPVAEVVHTLKEYYANSSTDPSIIQTVYTEFMRRNDGYISLLAKEFEMKKAATAYKKSKRSDTGDLNITKLYRYKLLDDLIFKKRMKVYKGKSHGIMLLLDKSGSMNSMMEDSIEQILVLALFCRKVQIPFAAYSFHSTPNSDLIRDQLWTYRQGDLEMGTLMLRQIVHSQLSATDFQEAVMYQSFLAQQYREYSRYGMPYQEHLASTPLNEALVAMDDILNTFREQHRVDLAHLIIVQDGDTDGNCRVITGRGGHQSSQFVSGQEALAIMDDRTRQFWVSDTSKHGSTAAILKWLRHRTGVQVFGMYVIPPGSRYASAVMGSMFRTKSGSMVSSNEDQAKLLATLREDRYLESYSDGYTRFSFIIAKKKKQDEPEDLQDLIRGNATKAKVGTAFAKMFEKKAMNRLLATKFIPLIAAGERCS